MAHAQSTDERFIHLEIKVAYQEKLLFELNEVLLAHTRTIDSLEMRVHRLEGLLREQGPGGEAVGHEKPPHY